MKIANDSPGLKYFLAKIESLEVQLKAWKLQCEELRTALTLKDNLLKGYQQKDKKKVKGKK